MRLFVFCVLASAVLSLSNSSLAQAKPTVTITLVDPYGASEGTQGRAFEVHRTKEAVLPKIVIPYFITGTATNGVDYQTLSGKVVIQENELKGSIKLDVTDDHVADPEETVTIKLKVFPNSLYILGDPRTQTLIIHEYKKIVTIKANDSAAIEPHEIGNFQITKVDPIGEPLLVNVSITGTATNGVDYQTIPGSITVPSDTSVANVPVTPIDDKLKEDTETVIMTILPGPGYTVGTPSQETVTLTDDDIPPAIHWAAGGPTQPTEAGQVGRFCITLDKYATSLQVHLSIGGTATRGVDYKDFGDYISTSNDLCVQIIAIDDTVPDPDETIVITLLPDPAYSTYTLTEPTAVTLVIQDND